MIEIRQRYTRVVIRTVNAANLVGAKLPEANLSRADLTEANLVGAKLPEANLSRADLAWANLSKANLSGANLRAANLSWANLFKADLTAANLHDADLLGANLRGADLHGAILTRAFLYRADFSGSNLAEANLTEIRDDFFAILSLARDEVAGLRLAVIEGRINGSSYEGPCACLIGTIAILQGCEYRNVPGIPIDAARPAERFFTGIGKGDTPETNPVSAIVLGWIDEFTALPTAQ